MSETEGQGKTKKWLWVRLLIVGNFVSGGPALAEATPDYIPSALLVLCMAHSYFSTLSILKRFRRSPPRYQNWETPTWFTNPFSGAAQFFHLGSYCSMGLGLTASILAALAGRNVVIPLSPAVFGLGIYVGIMRFYRRLDAPDSSSNQLPQP